MPSYDFGFSKTQFHIREARFTVISHITTSAKVRTPDKPFFVNKETSPYDFGLSKTQFDIREARLILNKEVDTLLAPKIGVPFSISLLIIDRRG